MEQSIESSNAVKSVVSLLSKFDVNDVYVQVSPNIKSFKFSSTQYGFIGQDVVFRLNSRDQWLQVNVYDHIDYDLVSANRYELLENDFNIVARLMEIYSNHQ